MKPEPPQRHSSWKWRLPLLLIPTIALLIIGSFKLVDAKGSQSIAILRSGYVGYCLTAPSGYDKHLTTATNATCDGSTAQQWHTLSDTIRHTDLYCLGVPSITGQATLPVQVQRCTNSSHQQWLHYLDGYRNPATMLCLAGPSINGSGMIEAVSCDKMDQLRESWTPDEWNVPVTAISAAPCNSGNEGQRVACYATRQWVAWQANPGLHTTLLTDYTDGNPSEPWCADFVSYVYREAGRPFTNADRDNWDEYRANALQVMNLQMHDPAHYVPKAGDIAYFDYPGGHVEIVVKGGPHPVFIYGDSGTTDPATHNGNMSENSFMNDGDGGQLEYYLSPS